jgi:hypothetical protein
MMVILAYSYRAKRMAPGCGNVAQAIVRYADAGGRPLRQEESWIAHTTEAKNVAAADGLKIHDDRKRWLVWLFAGDRRKSKLHCGRRAD